MSEPRKVVFTGRHLKPGQQFLRHRVMNGRVELLSGPGLNGPWTVMEAVPEPPGTGLLVIEMEQGDARPKLLDRKRCEAKRSRHADGQLFPEEQCTLFEHGPEIKHYTFGSNEEWE